MVDVNKNDYDCECEEELPVYKSTDDNPPRDPHCTLYTLCDLLEHKISDDLTNRHLILFDQAIKACKYGFYVEDLKYVICIIEKIAERIDNEPVYIESFKKFLSICELLPLTNDVSTQLTHMNYIEEYMSILGFLLIWLSDSNLRIYVSDVLLKLFKRKSRLALQSVTFDWIARAVEGSHLPEILIQLTESSNYSEYREYLNVILLVSEISPEICRKMVYGGALDTIMLRFEAGFSFLTEFHTATISDIDVWVVSAVDISIDILMNLVDSLMNAGSDILAKVRRPCRNALWCLRFGIRNDIIRNRSFERNHKTVLLLKLIQVFPDADYLGAGFIEAILLFSTFTEMKQLSHSWINMVHMKYDENLILFKKLNLTALYCVLKEGFVQQRMVKMETMGCLIKLISLKSDKFAPEHCISLAKLVFHIFHEIGVDLIDDFIKFDGTVHMLIIIESYFLTDSGIDKHLIELCFKTILKFLRSDNENFFVDFKKHYGFAVLSHFCKIMLSQARLTMFDRKLLAYFFVIYGLICKEPFVDYDIICLIINYMKRVTEPRVEDSHLDFRTIICAIDLLWKMIEKSDTKLKYFIENSGIYTLMDLLVKMPDFVKMFGLGCLIDMCRYSDVIEFLLTWRGGPNKKITIYKFLLDAFNKENFVLEVKLSPDRVIENLNAPLMGKTQYEMTFNSNAILTSSPTVLDLYGSVRPKVYAMLQILDVRNAPLTRKLKKRYKSIFANTLSTADNIVMIMAENYLVLKIGEAWKELQEDTIKTKFKPILFDQEMLNIIIKQNLKWIKNVKQKQLNALRQDKFRATVQEMKFYNTLRSSKIQDALDGLREMQYIARSSDRLFMLRHKYKQTTEIKQYLSEKKSTDNHTDYFAHNTYFEDISTTAVFRQKLILKYNI